MVNLTLPLINNRVFLMDQIGKFIKHLSEMSQALLTGCDTASNYCQCSVFVIEGIVPNGVFWKGIREVT